MTTEVPSRSICDRVGDCALAIIDEGKFWVEVFSEFMEWDEMSQQRWADAQMRKLNSDMTGRGSQDNDASKMTLQQAQKVRT